jgi:hypothetical protein
MLSKKYYKVLAELLRGSSDLADFKEKLITFCNGDNERFSETRFRQASKV